MGEALQTVELDANMPEPTVAVSAQMTPMQMAFQLIQGGADIGSVKEMLAVSKELAADQARRAFDAALSAAKADIPVIIKNRKVDFTSQKGRTNYRHEDLAEIARTVDPILARHGLSYRFRTTNEPNSPISVTCIVSHRDGYSEENTLSAGRDDTGNKNAIQQVGSTITYLQRYTLKAALGLAASNDDDGRASEQQADDRPISDEQLKSLRERIVSVGADEPIFCDYFKIEAVEYLPASQFDRAMKALGKKGAQK